MSAGPAEPEAIDDLLDCSMALEVVAKPIKANSSGSRNTLKAKVLTAKVSPESYTRHLSCGRGTTTQPKVGRGSGVSSSLKHAVDRNAVEYAQRLSNSTSAGAELSAVSALSALVHACSRTPRNTRENIGSLYGDTSGDTSGDTNGDTSLQASERARESLVRQASWLSYQMADAEKRDAYISRASSLIDI